MIKFCMQSIRCIVLITKSVDCALQIVVVTVRVELSQGLTSHSSQNGHFGDAFPPRYDL